MAFRVTQVHWEFIVNFMEKYPGVAKGRIDGPVGKEKMKKLWEQLAQELNALGMGTRTSEKWKKSWIDFKYNLKRRASDTKIEFKATGGGSPKISPLTDLEIRILNILGDSFFQGSGLPENGCSFMSPPHAIGSTFLEQRNEEANTIFPDEENAIILPSTSNADINQEKGKVTNKDHDYSRTPSKKKPRKVKPDTQSDLEKMYRETITELRDIKNVLKELCEYINGIQTALNTIATKL